MSDIAYRTVLPEGWPRPRGYAHAVLAQGGTQIRVAGQIGRLPEQAAVEPGADFGVQWGRAMANLVAVLAAAGATPAHVLALRVYVTDLAQFNASGAAIGAAWAQTLGRHFPAMTLVQVSALVDPNAVVEIEAEALLP